MKLKRKKNNLNKGNNPVAGTRPVLLCYTLHTANVGGIHPNTFEHNIYPEEEEEELLFTRLLTTWRIRMVSLGSILSSQGLILKERQTAWSVALCRALEHAAMGSLDRRLIACYWPAWESYMQRYRSHSHIPVTNPWRPEVTQPSPTVSEHSCSHITSLTRNDWLDWLIPSLFAPMRL